MRREAKLLASRDTSHRKFPGRFNMSSAAPSSPDLRTKDYLLKILDTTSSESETEKLNPRISLISNKDDDGNNDEDLSNEFGSFSREISFTLFKKFLLSKPQSPSDMISRRPMPPRPLVPPKFGSNEPRPPSMLEQRLLPGINERTMHLSSSGDRSVTSQLTIFYGGAVSVFDNVPIDKAQTIMLLAGESSVSKKKTSFEREAVKEMEKKSPKPKSSHPYNFPSICKLQDAEFPIVRSNSLRRFLEKRQERIANKSTPYPASARASGSTSPRPTKQNENDAGASSSKGTSKGAMEGLDVNKPPALLSPFPSRLGYFCPILANKTQ